MRNPNFKPQVSAGFRTIPEPAILDLLLLVSWAFEVAAGQRDVARESAARALNGWIDQGLGYGHDSDGQRLFDPVEVINHMKWTGLTGQDSYWEEHFVKTHRGFLDEFDQSQGGNPAAPNRFRMKLRRTFELKGLAPLASVRLRAPLPLQGPYVRDLRIEPEIEEQYQNDKLLREHCLEVRLKATGVPQVVTIGATFTFAATRPSAGLELPPGERELYTRKTEGFIRVTPRIEALASGLSSPSSSDKDAVAAFWNYLMGTLCSGMIRYSEVPPECPGEWVLDNGWYDCQLGSALLVSLCRAKGIPARLVSGHFLYRVQPISHYWSEIWFDEIGWCPFDVICWDLSRGGKDQSWRDVFAGRIDDRAVTQCFPLAFTGPMTVRFPPAWQMIQMASGTGVDIAYFDLRDQSLIYRDHVEIENLGPT